MTFLDHSTTREAQKVRNSKRDKHKRPAGKYDTPDRPGTNLAYSMTGKGNGARSDMAAALEAAGLAPKRRKGKPSKPKNRPQEARNPNAARMMRRIAGDA